MTVTAGLLKHDLDEAQIAAWLELFCEDGVHPDDVIVLFTRGRRHWDWWPKPVDVLPELTAQRDRRRKAETRLITDEQAWAVDGADHIKRFRDQRLAKLTAKVGRKLK